MEAVMLQWKRHIQKHLGRKMSPKYRDIALDILSVAEGVKPGFLFDYGSVTGEQIGCLLQSLCRENVMTNSNLCAVGVDTDIIIVNPECLEQYLIFVKANGSFIDVSSKRKEPCIMERNSCQINTNVAVATQISSDSRGSMTGDSKHYSSHIPSSANVSTIYGLLCGYPVVYWYETSDIEQFGKCLSLEPLRIFEVWGILDGSSMTCVPPDALSLQLKVETLVSPPGCDRHLIYSFSVPERCVSGFRGNIDIWLKSKLNSNLSKSVFTNLTLTEHVTIEPVVIL